MSIALTSLVIIFIIMYGSFDYWEFSTYNNESVSRLVGESEVLVVSVLNSFQFHQVYQCIHDINMFMETQRGVRDFLRFVRINVTGFIS